MRYRFLIIFSLFLSIAQAQSLKLTGKLLNEKNEPLPSISVKVAGGAGTSTDIDGRFSLNLVPGKKYEIEFTGIGYSSKTVTEVEVKPGETNELNIQLEVKAATMIM